MSSFFLSFFLFLSSLSTTRFSFSIFFSSDSTPANHPKGKRTFSNLHVNKSRQANITHACRPTALSEADQTNGNDQHSSFPVWSSAAPTTRLRLRLRPRHTEAMSDLAAHMFSCCSSLVMNRCVSCLYVCLLRPLVNTSAICCSLLTHSTRIVPASTASRT